MQTFSQNTDIIHIHSVSLATECIKEQSYKMVKWYKKRIILR